MSSRHEPRPERASSFEELRPTRGEIAIPGRNCWRRCHAARAAFLVDAESYFDALYHAALRARESIFVVGWDIDSRTPLRYTRGNRPTDRLGRFLARLVGSRRQLHVYVLGWDFPFIFAADREFLPSLNFSLRRSRRLHFHLDGTYPTGTSCHQKMVVIDDAVAFVGGTDLTDRRWDTSEHRERDPRRRDARGRIYPPIHDAMMLVDGEAAAAVGALARERWLTATGDAARAPGATAIRAGRGLPAAENALDPWPPGVQPDVTDVTVALARTQPPCAGDTPTVREIEQLYLDTIGAARRRLYIENQFFTARSIGEALERRLAEPNGPEIVVVTSRLAMTWLEETTMGVLRARLVRRLRDADVHGRLRVYCPMTAGPEPEGIKVHSKIVIADDRIVRIGSANVNNRSMQQDPELDLQVDAAGDPRVVAAVKNFRDRLIGEHLGVDPLVFGGTIEVTGSLIESIEILRGEGRTLEPLPELTPEWLDQLMPDEEIVDPGQPLKPDDLIDKLVPVEAKTPEARRAWYSVFAWLGVIAALTVLWRFTPLAGWLEPRALAGFARPYGLHPAGPLVVAAAYAAGGLLAVPVNLLILATALAFGPVLGFGYSLLGFMTSAAVTYWAGARLGRSAVRRLVGRRLNRITRRLDRRSVLAMAVLRLIPVAPYTLVNLVAGASHLRFRSYMLGTLLGMLPGTLAITLLGRQLGQAFREPSPLRVATVVSLAVLIAVAGWAVARWFSRRTARAASGARGALGEEGPERPGGTADGGRG